MKIITSFIILLLFSSCNPPGSSKEDNDPVNNTSISDPSSTLSQPDSSVTKHKVKIHPIVQRKIDTVLLMNTSHKIVKLIKNRKYKEFSLFIHPQDGLRFSPYAYIDTIKDWVLSTEQFLKLVNQNTRINWNSSWEADKPELLTIDEYFKKFVYDVDFLNAELKSINQYHSQGTDLNNIKEAYPECDVVEFFFSGFEEKYGGHDFRGLRLVYKMKNNKLYLIGLVHDQWTP